jgi:DNA-binding MarR family transcriptional regulator
MTSLQSPLAERTTAAARLRFVLVRLARTLRREGESTLTASQVSALATVEEMGPLRISALAAHESMDPSVATRVVAGLESLGLLERTDDPDDRRASLIDLSHVGRATLSELWHERTLRLSARLERLTAKERHAIEAALPALDKLTRDA